MTDVTVEAAAPENMENPTYAPPDSVLIQTLRSEVANMNDARLHYQAQVSFQADLIAGLQAQLQASTEALLAAGLPIPNSVPDEG